MKTLKNMTGDSLEQMIDYKVVDQNGASIGTLHSLWSDPTTGAVEFLGVKTGWIFGQNHVVPAEKAELDESENVVRLPYTDVFIKEAPAISAEAEISEEQEENIYQYYGLGGGEEAGENDYGAPGNLPDAISGGTFTPASRPDLNTTSSSPSRLRRTSRSDAGAERASIAGTAGGSSLDDIGPTDSSARASISGTEPGSFATANMFGSTGSMTATVAADSAGASSLDPVAGMSDSFADRIGSNVTDPSDENAGLARQGRVNADALSGEPGSHPLGTGAGALAAGAAGLAIGGAVGGPVGAPLGAAIGAVVGAVGGGYAGKGIAESINPTDEDAYWRSNYRNTSYHEQEYDYSDYSPGYRAGYEGFAEHGASGRDYSDVEGDLEQNYNRSRGGSRLGWDKAKAAARDAWDRLKNRTVEANRD